MLSTTSDFMMRVWVVAYGGNGKPKEQGGERHDAVESPPMRKLLPLDIAGGRK